ncbi:MAG: hypothetical protein RI953_2096 [Pseudomonadota bacterium]
MAGKSSRKTGLLAPMAIVLGSWAASACGGSLFNLVGSRSSSSAGAPSQPASDAPLPPVSTTGAFLTGVLADENGVAYTNTWVTLVADGSRIQTDTEGKIKFPFSTTAATTFAVKIELANAQTVSADIVVPANLKQAFDSGTSASMSLSIVVQNNGTISAATIPASAPVTKTVTPSAALVDAMLSRLEISSTDPAVYNLPLFSVTSSGAAQTSYAVINLSQPCNKDTVFTASMPLVKDMASYDPQSLRVCIKQTSADNIDSFAQSIVFKIQMSPIVFKGFLNDSDGKYARFFWNDTDTEAATQVKLAYSDTQSDIDSWDGQNNPAGVVLVNDFSNCTDISYRTSGSGAFGNTSGKCGFDLSTASVPVPAWGKRHFRFYILKASKEFLSPRVTVGHVPPGMVLVAKESWPAEYQTSTNASHYDGHSLGGGAYGPFDYAIDKYEVSPSVPLSNTDNNTVRALSTYTFNAAVSAPNNFQLVSKPNVAAWEEGSWFAFKQGCENRKSDAATSTFVGTGVRRNPHLATDLEWFVASAGTPDKAGSTNCNIDGSSTSVLLPGDIKTASCLSDSGARDMIGNLMEWTDGLWSRSGTNPTRTTFYGATGSTVNGNIPAPNNGSAISNSETYIAGWDPLFAFFNTLSASASAQFMSDQAVNLASGATNIGSLRGGWYKKTYGLGSSGRFQLVLSYAATSSGDSMNVGGRCALVAP